MNTLLMISLSLRNPNESVKLNASDPTSLRNAQFNEGPIKFIFHGYAGNYNLTPNAELRPGNINTPPFKPSHLVSTHSTLIFV